MAKIGGEHFKMQILPQGLNEFATSLFFPAIYSLYLIACKPQRFFTIVLNSFLINCIIQGAPRGCLYARKFEKFLPLCAEIYLVLKKSAGLKPKKGEGYRRPCIY